MKDGSLLLQNDLNFWEKSLYYGKSGDGPQIKTFIQKGICAMLFVSKEKGQGLVEYAIILALIAVVVLAVMSTLGTKVRNTFNSISASLSV